MLTDKYFYLSYKRIFSEEFYHDYNKVNRRLIRTFQIQVPDEIKEIVEFEEGEPMVLSYTEMYYFIKGFAEDLKKLTDGPALIRSKIRFLEARDWMRLERIIQERELKKVFNLDDKITEKELYVDTIHEVSDAELFHQHIVTIHWKKFDEIRCYIQELSE